MAKSATKCDQSEVRDTNFENGGTYAVDGNPDYVAVGDFNGDSNLDLVVSNTTTNDISVLLGNGNGTFQSATNITVGSSINANQVVTGDFNGDGKLDIAVACSGSSGYVAVLLGNGNGTFAAQANYPVGYGCTDLTAGDLNNDGKMDLVSSNDSDNTLSVLLGNGNGTFQSAANIGVPSYPGTVVIGDFNDDGKPDLAVPSWTNNQVAILLGNGNGTFQSATNISVGSSPWAIAGLDVVGNNNTDLVVLNFSGDNMMVLAGNGNGTFSTEQTSSTGTFPGGVAVGDFTGNGFKDIAVSNAVDSPTGSVSIFLDVVTNSLANITTFAYDAANRKISETQTLGTGTETTTFLYDHVGNLTSSTDALGRVIDYQYDALNRLTTETWYDAGGTIIYDTLNSTYDAVGNQLTAGNAQGIYTMTYDAANRMTVVNELFGQSLTFMYDALGNETVIQDSQGGLTTSLYDADERLSSRQVTGNSQTLRVDLTYQSNGLLSTLKRFSNLAATTTVMTTTYLYDAADQVTAITDFNASGTVLASFAYTYDPGGRLATETDKGAAPITYTYNVGNELLTDGTSTYTYDAAGNRSSAGYTVTGGNEVTNDGTYTYTYDAVGNLIEKSKGASAETWTYGYDDKNELIWVEERATPGGTLEMSATYKYDWYGHRVEMDVDDDGAGPDPTVVTRFAYVGDEIWADLNSSNSLVTRYVRGDVEDQLFGRVSGGATGWYVTDHLGSVWNVVDNSASFLATATYDAWGNATTTGAIGRYEWTGKEFDAATGLQYNLARYYDPTTGTWITQDPMGFAAGDSNLYRYVNDAPTDGTDPSGLFEDDVHLYMTAYIADAIGLNSFYFGVGKSWLSVGNLIAWADQYTDLDISTRPAIDDDAVNYQKNNIIDNLRKFHFRYENFGTVQPGSEIARQPLIQGLKERNPLLIGIGLHAYQDSWSHSSFDVEVRFGRRDVLKMGHTDVEFGGHAVDYPWYLERNKRTKGFVEAMAKETYDYLAAYYKDLCSSVKVTPNGKEMLAGFQEAAPGKYLLISNAPTSTSWADVWSKIMKLLIEKAPNEDRAIAQSGESSKVPWANVTATRVTQWQQLFATGNRLLAANSPENWFNSIARGAAGAFREAAGVVRASQ